MSEKASKDQIDRAYVLFMSYREKDFIIEQTGISESTYDRRAAEWRPIRREKIEKELQARNELAAQHITKIQLFSLPVLYNAIKYRASIADKKPITMYEANALADVLTKIDKMARLSMDQATENISENLKITEAKLDMNRMLNALKKNGYIEYVPLKGESNDIEIDNTRSDGERAETRDTDTTTENG